MDKTTLSEYRELKDWSVEIGKTNSIEFNSGSESSKHVVAKALVGHVGLANGYRVSSEVQVSGGSIDVCLWGNLDRLSYAVEVETAPTQEVVDDKRERYVSNTPLDDMLIINISEMSDSHRDALHYVSEQLGLDA